MIGEISGIPAFARASRTISANCGPVRRERCFAGVWIPLRAALTPANTADNEQAAELLTDLPEAVRFVLGDGISVGHRAVLHGCTVGDDTLVGMGSVVLNGARIGPRCLVAAGALVLEGVEIPAQSLVAGAPAKVRRPLTDDEVERLRANAATYEELMRLHAGSATS